MAQPKAFNHTVGTHQILFSQDESLAPIVAPIVKATFDISLAGELRFAKEQLPINLDGEFYGDPTNSSYLFEPEIAFTKPKVDVVIIADAVSSVGAVTHLPVTIGVGQQEKRFIVFGERYWHKDRLNYVASSPQPFVSLPLIYEHAFGGWDRRAQDPARHGFESRNTVGKGFFDKRGGTPNEKLLLPNIELADALITDIEAKPQPAGCGFTLPHWQPRAALAGTYDDRWNNSRSPLLPTDFNRGFYNAASEGLMFDREAIVNQPVFFQNLTSTGHLSFQLPKIRPPVCHIELKSHFTQLTLNLDTIIINLRSMTMQYMWRNHLVLNRGPHDCNQIDIYNG